MAQASPHLSGERPKHRSRQEVSPGQRGQRAVRHTGNCLGLSAVRGVPGAASIVVVRIYTVRTREATAFQHAMLSVRAPVPAQPEPWMMEYNYFRSRAAQPAVPPRAILPLLDAL